ncbi:MAG: hypothetical protein ACJ79A_17795 [Gemmatimonadaceae bacterium]
MHDGHLPRRGLESLKKEAKRWLGALRASDPDAQARLHRALPHSPPAPTLRHVQLALAREHGFAGWADLKHALEVHERDTPRLLARYEEMAEALLDAYRTGTPEAMARHHRLTWHRRAWPAVRTYVQLDLGKRPATPGADVEISLDDARHLIAHEHGFDDWEALRAFARSAEPSPMLATKPVSLVDARARDGGGEIATSRDWHAVVEALRAHPTARLVAHGQLTDAALELVAGTGTLTSLDASGSRTLTDAGIVHLARLPALEHLDLSGTAVTDRGLSVVLRALPRLRSLSVAWTQVTDAGIEHVAGCDELRRLDLFGTATGDRTIAALAGRKHLHWLSTGQLLTDAGIPLLHELPMFETWHGGEVAMGLTSYETAPNQLVLRGAITDRGMRHMRGLDGLFGLNLDDARLTITAAALQTLVELPKLGWLAVDAKDDWMPLIAAMPALRFFGAQDTVAGDEGFVALSRSQSIEYIWGRRCHNLRRRGFTALANMPHLRALSVSCLNVDDAGVAALPSFPALRELMPMDVPDAGYRHIAKCSALEALILMYCRDTTDAATEHLTALPSLSRYFNSYTTITDRTPALLSTMDSLEDITFDTCHNLTNAGIARLSRLPRLRRLAASGRGLTPEVGAAFGRGVSVRVRPG